MFRVKCIATGYQPGQFIGGLFLGQEYDVQEEREVPLGKKSTATMYIINGKSYDARFFEKI